MPYLKSFLFLTLIFILLSCSKAEPVPDSGFLAESEKLQSNENIPFNRVWVKENVNWGNYKSIHVLKVNTDYVEKMDWWDKASTAGKDKSEIPVLAEYMHRAVTKAFANAENSSFVLVDEPDGETLFLELAIVEVIPTKVWLNVIGYATLGALDKGSIAIEGRVVDAKTGKILAMFADHERGQWSLFSFADLTWHSHAKDVIDVWAEQLVELANDTDGHKIEDSSVFTLRPW